MKREFNLRPYGHPGKFEGGLAIDELAYDLSLAGCDGEIGDCETTGHYCLLRGPFRSSGEFCDITPVEIAELELTPDELAFLARTAGCIIEENSQGFVSVEWYEDEIALNESWGEIETDLEAMEDEED